jgi:hypothetical protein
VKNWVAIDVHNINKDRVVKIRVLIVSQDKLESAWGLAMLLAVGAELSEVFDCFLISVMARAFKNPM